jgi:hypothetical protein
LICTSFIIWHIITHLIGVGHLITKIYLKWPKGTFPFQNCNLHHKYMQINFLSIVVDLAKHFEWTISSWLYCSGNLSLCRWTQTKSLGSNIIFLRLLLARFSYFLVIFSMFAWAFPWRFLINSARLLTSKFTRSCKGNKKRSWEQWV